MSKPTVRPTENHMRAVDEAKDRRIAALEAQVASLEKQVQSRDEQIDTQAKRLEGCTDEVMVLRGRLQEAEAKVTEQGRYVLQLSAELSQRIQATPQPPPAHVVRSFEAGARAERARVLEQSRIELLSWHAGTPERRALESLRRDLQDERLPLPEFKP